MGHRLVAAASDAAMPGPGRAAGAVSVLIGRLIQVIEVAFYRTRHEPEPAQHLGAADGTARQPSDDWLPRPVNAPNVLYGQPQPAQHSLRSARRSADLARSRAGRRLARSPSVTRTMSTVWSPIAEFELAVTSSTSLGEALRTSRSQRLPCRRLDKRDVHLVDDFEDQAIRDRCAGDEQ